MYTNPGHAVLSQILYYQLCYPFFLWTALWTTSQGNFAVIDYTAAMELENIIHQNFSRYFYVTSMLLISYIASTQCFAPGLFLPIFSFLPHYIQTSFLVNIL